MKKMKAIISLRFIFILMVFIHHFDSFAPYYSSAPSSFASSIIFEGFVGVTFFMILSGFVCSYGYKERFLSSDISGKEFLIRRISKLYPAYIFL